MRVTPPRIPVSRRSGTHFEPSRYGANSGTPEPRRSAGSGTAPVPRSTGRRAAAATGCRLGGTEAVGPEARHRVFRHRAAPGGSIRGRPRVGRRPPGRNAPGPDFGVPEIPVSGASNGMDYRSTGVPGQPRRATVRPSRRSGVPGYRTVRPGGGGPDLRATRQPRRRRKGDRVPRDSGGPRLRGGRAIFRLARHTGPPEYSPDTAGFS